MDIMLLKLIKNEVYATDAAEIILALINANELINPLKLYSDLLSGWLPIGTYTEKLIVE